MIFSNKSRMTIILVLYVLIILEICTSQYVVGPAEININDLVPRVVNGRPASLGDVPYQIAFKMLASRLRNTYTTFCGGTIISNSKLLSAAHCFEAKKSGCWAQSIHVSGSQLARVYAVAGNLMNIAEYTSDNPGGTGGQWRKLRVVIYPAVYKFPKHDISVVMTDPFDFNEYIAPIPYAKRFVDYRGECLVSGYGRITPPFEHNKVSTDKLLLANLAIIPTFTCNRRHRMNMRSFICTSSLVSDASKGDSGGPLVCFKTGHPEERDKGILVGIVSGNRRGAGSFFTRVSSYYKYIERNKANSLLVPTYLYLYVAINYGFYLF